MAQKRYFEYLADDSTFFQLNARSLGINSPGLYRGFDFTPTANMSLTMSHSLTGAVRTLLNETLSVPFGIVVTKQGTVIHEEDQVVLALNPTAGAARRDVIVCEHKYTEVEGGQTAQYLVIQGPQGGAKPALTKPNIQTEIATVYIPANVASLNNANVVYEKAGVPAFANNSDYVKRKGGVLLGNLDAGGNKITNLADGTSDSHAVNLKQMNDALENRLPKNCIVIWSGSIATIPANFKLCNGGNGTPDLRGRFVIGANTSGAYLVGNNGGNSLIKISEAQLPSHTHSVTNAGAHTHTGSTNSTGSHTHSGSANSSGSHTHSGSTNAAGAHTHTITAGGGSSGPRDYISVDTSLAQYLPKNTLSAGNHTHTLSINSAGAHTHSLSINSAGSHSHTVSVTSAGSHTHTIGNTGSNADVNIMNPYYSLAYIMRV